MFTLLSKPKTRKKSITLRIDQIKWIDKKASAGDATFSGVLQSVVDVVMQGQGLL